MIGSESNHRFDGLTVVGGFDVTRGRAYVNETAIVASGGVSVMDCGAVGDGVTDDTAAIVRALQAAKTTSGGNVEVFFPAGRFRFTQPLVFGNNVSVRGVGARPHNQGGTDLWYDGADGQNAITLGSAGSDWSNCKFGGMRITKNSSLTLTSGRGLVVINPTNLSEVSDVYVSGFPDGQIQISNATGGASNPGPNFFRLTRFFVSGGVAPLEVDGGVQQTMIDFGGIDLDATSSQGFLQSNGSAASQVTMVQGVKVEGSFDVPGYKHAGLGATLFVGCNRQNNGSALTSAGPAFLFDNPGQQDCHMGILGCGTVGCTVGVSAPGLTVSASVNSSGGYIPWFLVGGGGGSGVSSSMFAPSNATYKSVVLHQDVLLAWAAAGDPKTTDTNLYRSSADRLKTDDLFQASLGVATITKAGTPSDADWSVAPPVGTIVVDTTASKIWVRTAAATWKGVVVA